MRGPKHPEDDDRPLTPGEFVTVWAIMIVCCLVVLYGVGKGLAALVWLLVQKLSS